MINFTDEQEALIREAIVWYHTSSDQVFEYSAPAGAGKSTVMHAIIEALGLKESEVAPMAYTGAASVIMRRNGFLNARTIHSWIFTPLNQSELAEILGRNDKEYLEKYGKFKFKGFDSYQQDTIKLICIDEAAQVSRDIVNLILMLGKKIIACGDLNQLPPVIGEPGFLNPEKHKVYFLTKIMRQAEGSPIVQIANCVKNGYVPPFGQYGKTFVIPNNLFKNRDIFAKILKDTNYTVLTGYNRTRDDINYLVRHSLFGVPEYMKVPFMGEKLICRTNDWTVEKDGINLVNGLIGNCMANINITSMDMNSAFPTFKLLFKPLFMQEPFDAVRCDYRYMVESYKDRREALLQYERQILKYKASASRLGEKFEYAYAITVHLSQGSQFDCGVYYQEPMGRNPEDLFSRQINYTAVTRFKNFFIYVVPDRHPLFMAAYIVNK